MSIYISTGAFKDRHLRSILSVADKMGIKRIELAPGMIYNEDTIDVVRQSADKFSFLIHNYFPTPKVPFGLNLASGNDLVIEKSMNMCKANVDLCAELGIPFYSVHCGYCFDTDGSHLGNASQLGLSHFSMERAKEIFVRNLTELSDYADYMGVTIAIENNVLAEYAAKEREMYLGISGRDMREILDLCKRNNLKVLLDLAHAKVSNTYMGFGVSKMIKELGDDIIEVHISENNGRYDQNLPITPDSTEMMGWLKQLLDKTWTIEVYDLDENKIMNQIDMLDSIKRRQ